MRYPAYRGPDGKPSAVRAVGLAIGARSRDHRRALPSGSSERGNRPASAAAAGQGRAAAAGRTLQGTVIFYFFALSAAAAVLLFGNPSHETNRWAAFFLLCALVGGLEPTLREVGSIADAGSMSTRPSCLRHSGLQPRVRGSLADWPDEEAAAAALLFLPAVLMLAATPMRPALEIDFPLLLCWVGPYYAASCYVLVRALGRKKTPGGSGAGLSRRSSSFRPCWRRWRSSTSRARSSRTSIFSRTSRSS